MIELTTGLPGSGKSLSYVTRLAALFKRWEKHPDEVRPVFVHNIPHLAFPVSEVPFKQVQLSDKMPFVYVPDWSAMPDGSIVFIDECQGKIDEAEGRILYHCFPPRSSATIAPFHVAWLNTHRHHGFDIWLSTQHPKLIDGAVRALVGRHQHYRRLFGGSRAVCYEWDGCSDSLASKAAIKSFFPYPRDSFKFYKSAELHTKQKFKIPLWAFIPVIGLILGAIFVPKAYTVLHAGMTGKGLHENDASISAVSAVSAASSVSASAPMIAGSVYSPEVVGALAPVDAGQNKQEKALPAPLLISSCIATNARCQCYTDKGVKVPLSDSDCRASVDSPTTRFRSNYENTSPAFTYR